MFLSPSRKTHGRPQRLHFFWVLPFDREADTEKDDEKGQRHGENHLREGGRRGGNARKPKHSGDQ